MEKCIITVDGTDQHTIYTATVCVNNENGQAIGDTNINKIKEIRKISYGSYGDVLECEVTVRDHPNPRKVAGKFPMSAVHDDDIVREAKVLMEKRHENIIQCFGVYQIVPGYRNNVVMLLEFFPTNLREVIKKNVYSIEDSVTWMIPQMLDGVNFIHTEMFLPTGGIHRDLKPENILVDQATCRLVICDFNTARRNTESVQTYTGSEDYMAPELKKVLQMPLNAVVHTQLYTQAVDIWSCGLIIGEVQRSAKGAEELDRDSRIVSLWISSITAECLEDDAEDRPKISQVKKRWEYCSAMLKEVVNCRAVALEASSSQTHHHGGDGGTSRPTTHVAPVPRAPENLETNTEHIVNARSAAPASHNTSPNVENEIRKRNGRVHVCNLPMTADHFVICEHFSKAGKIAEDEFGQPKIEMFFDEGIFTGDCEVEYEEYESARHAIRSLNRKPYPETTQIVNITLVEQSCSSQSDHVNGACVIESDALSPLPLVHHESVRSSTDTRVTRLNTAFITGLSSDYNEEKVALLVIGTGAEIAVNYTGNWRINVHKKDQRITGYMVTLVDDESARKVITELHEKRLGNSYKRLWVTHGLFRERNSEQLDATGLSRPASRTTPQARFDDSNTRQVFVDGLPRYVLRRQIVSHFDITYGSIAEEANGELQIRMIRPGLADSTSSCVITYDFAWSANDVVEHLNGTMLPGSSRPLVVTKYIQRPGADGDSAGPSRYSSGYQSR